MKSSTFVVGSIVNLEPKTNDAGKTIEAIYNRLRTKPDKLYKIRKGDLFSTGSIMPKWSKKGKIWKRKQDVDAHLRLIQNKIKDLSRWKGNVYVGKMRKKNDESKTKDYSDCVEYLMNFYNDAEVIEYEVQEVARARVNI